MVPVDGVAFFGGTTAFGRMTAADLHRGRVAGRPEKNQLVFDLAADSSLEEVAKERAILFHGAVTLYCEDEECAWIGFLHLVFSRYFSRYSIYLK